MCQILAIVRDLSYYRASLIGVTFMTPSVNSHKTTPALMGDRHAAQITGCDGNPGNRSALGAGFAGYVMPRTGAHAVSTDADRHIFNVLALRGAG